MIRRGDDRDSSPAGSTRRNGPAEGVPTGAVDDEGGGGTRQGTIRHLARHAPRLTRPAGEREREREQVMREKVPDPGPYDKKFHPSRPIL